MTQIARRPRRRQGSSRAVESAWEEGGNEDRGKRRSVDREGGRERLREQVSSVTRQREGERGFAKASALAPPLANGKAQGFACLPPRWPISNLAGCAASKVDQSVNPAEKRAFLAATLPRPNSFRSWPEAEARDHEPFHARRALFPLELCVPLTLLSFAYVLLYPLLFSPLCFHRALSSSFRLFFMQSFSFDDDGEMIGVEE